MSAPRAIIAEQYLHVAVLSSLPEMASVLIDCGAEIDAKKTDGATPLHLVSNIGYVETAKMLMARGANINAKNGYGETPLHLAAKSIQTEIARLLIARGADIDAEIFFSRICWYLSFLDAQ